MRALVIGLALGLLALPNVQAQAEAASPSLTLKAFTTAPVPVQNGSTDAVVDWTYTFATAAVPGNTSIAWSMACGEGTILLLDPQPTRVDFEAGQTSVSGQALLPLQAGPDAIGLLNATCHLQGDAAATPTTLAATGTTDFEARAAYHGAIQANLATGKKQAGPQKMIPYEVELRNLANARTTITFEPVESETRERWLILLPDPVILEPPGGPGKAEHTAIITVATTFHDGYVVDDGHYVVRLHAASTEDPTQTLGTIDLVLDAHAEGFYVPGPGPLVALAAIGFAALLRRRV